MTGYRLRIAILIISTVVCLGFAGAVGYSLLFRPDVYEVPIGGPFELMDSKGKTVTEASFEGRYMLIYFGYTYCPDVCPTRLLEMTHALEALEEVSPERAAKVVPVFISLDPERDTPQVIADYVTHFHPAMVGLTGSTAQLDAVMKAYRGYYRKVEPEEGEDPESYLVDHTSYVFLMGEKGQYVTHFPSTADAEDIGKSLVALID